MEQFQREPSPYRLPTTKALTRETTEAEDENCVIAVSIDVYFCFFHHQVIKLQAAIKYGEDDLPAAQVSQSSTSCTPNNTPVICLQSERKLDVGLPCCVGGGVVCFWRGRVNFRRFLVHIRRGRVMYRGRGVKHQSLCWAWTACRERHFICRFGWGDWIPGELLKWRFLCEFQTGDFRLWDRKPVWSRLFCHESGLSCRETDFKNETFGVFYSKNYCPCSCADGNENQIHVSVFVCL